MDPIYAIGDIHGQAAELDRALDLIEADGGADAPIVFLGDYTDRGPDSRGVLDRLIAGRDAGRPLRFVKGNHDRMFLRFVTEGVEHDANIRSGLSWMNARLGGPATLQSYGLGEGADGAFLGAVDGGRETLTACMVDGVELTLQELVIRAREAVPESHVAFLAGLERMIVTPEIVFVHAGLRPGVPLDAQVENDLVWIREGFLDDTTDHGRLVVHGHTALDAPAHFGNRVDLDGGAGFGRPLVPAVFEGRRAWLLGAGGRHPLEAPA